MRHGRAAALVLGSVLLAVLVVGLVPGGAARPLAGPAATRSGPAPAASPSITVATIDAKGTMTTDFYAGTAHGPDQVFFFVSDSNKSDRAANLSVTDPYAARDGLTNPVWTGQVGFSATDRNNTTTSSGLSFTVPSSLERGAVWTVTANATAAGTATAHFTVHAFYLTTEGNPKADSAVVPGEPVTLFWNALSSVNGGTYPLLEGISLDVSFTANGSVQSLYPGGETLPTSGLGSVGVSVPDNATPNTPLDWAFLGTVDNGTNVTETETATGVFYVGSVAIETADLSPTPTCSFTTYATTFVSGTTLAACLIAGASYEGSFSPVPSLAVSLAYWNATGPVTPPGGPPTQILTNSSGTAAATFQASSPPFTPMGTTGRSANSVRIAVRDPADENLTTRTAWQNLSFSVEPVSELAIVTVTLDEITYYTGDPVIANWSVTSAGGAGGSGYAPFAWCAYGWPADELLAEGNLSASSRSGSLSVPLPRSYTGQFSVEIEAENATTVAVGNATAWVRAPQILVTPSSPYYLPGTILTFTVSTVGGQVLSGASLYYVIDAYYASSGGTERQVQTGNGTVADGGDVLVAVPSNSTPVEYVVVVWAQSPTMGLYASSETSVAEAAGFQVLVGVVTDPGNPDGTYAPGQTVVVSYAINPYGTQPLARSYTIDLGILGTLSAVSLQTSGPAGNVTLVLPKDLPQGAVEIYADVSGSGLSGPNCDVDQCDGFTWIPVNPHPASAPAATPDLGFTEAWFLLLGIVVAVAIALFVLLRPRSPPAPLTRYYDPDLEDEEFLEDESGGDGSPPAAEP